MSTVVVTGASAGAGRAVVQAYARRGVALGLIARGRAGLEATRQECKRLGAADVVAAECDVADPHAVYQAAEQFAGRLGAPDVWVNNAMVSVFSPTWEITAAEYRRVTEEPIDPATWRDNLDTPVDADRDAGAHGDFDDRAESRSPALCAGRLPRVAARNLMRAAGCVRPGGVGYARDAGQRCGATAAH